MGSMGSETVTAKNPPFKRSEVHQFQEWPDKLSDKALVRFCILDFFDKNLNIYPIEGMWMMLMLFLFIANIIYQYTEKMLVDDVWVL